MNVMKSRRDFVRIAGAGLMTTGVNQLLGPAAADITGTAGMKQDDDLFGIGIAGYTFAQLSIETGIEIMKRVGVTRFSLKDIHLPVNSTKEEITSMRDKLENAGIDLYTVGVVYMRSPEAVDQAFEYANTAGVKLIVCAPDYELLPQVEQKVKTYNMRVAIHNHGPDNPLFPNATDIWNHIKDMDPRMGICLDIGHTTRDGENPAVDAERYRSRLFDIHVKDVTEASKAGRTVEMGRGIIDIPQFVATLRKIKYSGMCSLEFEKDMKDPLAGIAESIGYFKGVMACDS